MVSRAELESAFDHYQANERGWSLFAAKAGDNLFRYEEDVYNPLARYRSRSSQPAGAGGEANVSAR